MALCIIPARGGSRRIPGKNKKLFHGKPIIAYSIMAAQDSGLFERVIVSTDDSDIYSIATAYGAEVHKRRPEDARDEVGTQAVAKAVLEDMGNLPEYTCVIYPCAPMIDIEALRFGFYVLQGPPIDSMGGIQYVYTVDEDGTDAGQWYWGRVGAFMEGVPLTEARTVMVPKWSGAIDINTMDDWERAEKMYAKLTEVEA